MTSGNSLKQRSGFFCSTLLSLAIAAGIFFATGLALARDLARNLGGELSLVLPPAAIAPELPGQGNAFCLRLPASAPNH